MRIKKILLSSKAIALMLLLFGYVWIIGSDFITANIKGNTFSLFNIQLLKGLLFVTIASAGVYTLLYLKDQELEQSRRYTDFILGTIDVAILVVTEEGTIDSVNDAFINIFGYSKNEVLGQHFTKLLNEENFERGRYNFQQLMDGNALPNEEWSLYDKSGNHITLLINANILQSDEENFLIVSATDITKQKHTQDKLEHSLVEKEVLLSEIHHRVKNNLAIVSGLIQLQVYEEENPNLQEKLVTCMARIQTIGSIHEILYQSNNLAQLQFDKSIEQQVDNLSDMYDELHTIDLDLNLSPIKININQAVPTSLIINELVTNALQHAFSAKENNLITISLSENEDNIITLTISDNGSGLPNEFTSLSQNDTLGFQLVDLLLKQLEATFAVNSTKQGASFTIKFEKISEKGSSSGFVS